MITRMLIPKGYAKKVRFLSMHFQKLLLQAQMTQVAATACDCYYSDTSPDDPEFARLKEARQPSLCIGCMYTYK